MTKNKKGRTFYDFLAENKTATAITLIFLVYLIYCIILENKIEIAGVKIEPKEDICSRLREEKNNLSSKSNDIKVLLQKERTNILVADSMSTYAKILSITKRINEECD